MFDHIDTWIFDLDNTLYHPSARLFDQMNTRMTAFIMRETGAGKAEANRLRSAYWREHGATLLGMVAHHGTDPDHFLAEVHDIDLSALRPDPDLTRALTSLPGRRIVHTNGSRAHAARVLAARGIAGAFEAVYAIEDKALVPKPKPEAYRAVIDLAGLDPARAAIIEDDMRNLAVPKSLGMLTIWLRYGGGEAPGRFVDRTITHLNRFLGQVEVARSPGR